jgi:cytochrome P450
VPAPTYDVDFYSDAFIREPWPHYAAMRALGPVVWLPQHGNYALTRHKEVGECLRDPDTFCSGRGVAADRTACELMQGNSIASDGERHNAIRFAMAGPLLPGALKEVEPLIEALAEDLIERLVIQGEFDAMTDLASHLPLTVVRDLVGLPDFGKENMLRWGAAAFDLLGVQNERGRRALEIFLEQRDFIRKNGTRDALKEGSWTRRIHELVDEGALSAELAPFCIRDYINPSLDTTISATGQLIWQLSRHPDQWELLKRRPELITNAINEAVRLGSPIRSFSRHATRDVQIGEHEIEEGARVMVLYASANRDELVFDDPDTFDITRNPKLHLGFGSGIHMCVGMHLAQMEMGSLLRAMIPRVVAIHTGQPEMALNNTIYSFKSVPARFEAAVGQTAWPKADALRTKPTVEKAPGLIRARVVDRVDIAENIVSLTLEAAGDPPLPPWEAGAHVDIHIHAGLVRQYSLTGPRTDGLYRIAVQKEPASKGGSLAVHEKYSPGSTILIGPPRNNFPLARMLLKPCSSQVASGSRPSWRWPGGCTNSAARSAGTCPSEPLRACHSHPSSTSCRSGTA